MVFATSGIDLLVQILRYRISDPKTIYSTVTSENVGVASGVNNEIFYTNNMPLASGFDTHLRIGRWYYQAKSSDAACNGLRAYVFNIDSGSFRIPTSAVLAPSGERATVSYTWEEEQAYKFSDKELKLYIGDAITAVNNDCNLGYTFVVSGETFDVSPTVTFNTAAAHIYPLYATILVKQQLESEGFGDRIYVRDINITIDTSKGLGDLSKSLKELKSSYTNIINACILEGQEAAVTKIDTYSTLNNDIYYYQNSFTNNREFGY